MTKKWNDLELTTRTVLGVSYLFQIMQDFMIASVYRYLAYSPTSEGFGIYETPHLVFFIFLFLTLGQALFAAVAGIFSDAWGYRKLIIFAQFIGVFNILFGILAVIYHSITFLALSRIFLGASIVFYPLALGYLAVCLKEPSKRLRPFCLLSSIHGFAISLYFFISSTLTHSILLVSTPILPLSLACLIWVLNIFFLWTNLHERASFHKTPLLHSLKNLKATFQQPSWKSLIVFLFLIYFSFTGFILIAGEDFFTFFYRPYFTSSYWFFTFTVLIILSIIWLPRYFAHRVHFRYLLTVPSTLALLFWVLAILANNQFLILFSFLSSAIFLGTLIPSTFWLISSISHPSVQGKSLSLAFLAVTLALFLAVCGRYDFSLLWRLSALCLAAALAISYFVPIPSNLKGPLEKDKEHPFIF
jgi:MFS family permease